MNRAQNKRTIFSPCFLINLGLLILVIFLLYAVSDYPTMARVFPSIVLVMVLIVTAVDNINMFREVKKSGSSEETGGSDRSKRTPKVLYMVCLMFVFYLLLVLFGLLVATLLFLLLSGWSLGYKNLKTLMISSLIITAFVYVIFKVIMNSILPEVLIYTLIGG